VAQTLLCFHVRISFRNDSLHESAGPCYVVVKTDGATLGMAALQPGRDDNCTSVARVYQAIGSAITYYDITDVGWVVAE
jgi:hypothetical protein